MKPEFLSASATAEISDNLCNCKKYISESFPAVICTEEVVAVDIIQTVPRHMKIKVRI